MTIQAGSVLSLTSIDDAIAADTPPAVATYSFNPLLPQIDAIYSRLQYDVFDTSTAPADCLAHLSESGYVCDASIVPKITYDIWRKDAAYCNLRVTETLFASAAGCAWRPCALARTSPRPLRTTPVKPERP